MKILQVNKYYHTRDGVGRYMFDLMRLLEGAGHVTAPFAMHDPRNLPSVWSEYFVSEMDTSRARIGLHAFKQLERTLWSREAKAKMERVLDMFKPDVVHAHNLYTHLSPSVLLPCSERGIPVVMTVHDYALVSADYTLSAQSGNFVKGSLLASVVQDVVFRLHKSFRLYDKHISHYVAVSEFVRDTLASAGYDKEKITVVPPAAGPLLRGFDGPIHGSAQRSTPTVRNGVLFAGRLETYKGIELYLELAKKYPDDTFFVAGTGPLEAMVREAAAKHKNIMYLGFLSADDLWAKMAGVRCVIVPSVWFEPFGLVPIEAMALGTPVIVSDSGGLPEAVRASKGGRVFHAGDLSDLSKKFDALMWGDEWQEASGAGREYVIEKHSPQAFLTRILKVYEGVRYG